MSPALRSKSKSKDKSSTTAAKEQKAASKSFAPVRTANVKSSANPISGTVHLPETSSAASSSPPHGNGSLQNIDDSDDRSSSPHGTVSEYDSVSNNGSCSGESEDLKDQATSSVPQRDALSAADNERREKIRLKNEKKHQRQRERRAQELHEKCCGYLMSRKLQVLSQQLVNMGFSSERATLALMMNEGRVEDSVSWLFEVEEEAHSKETGSGDRGNLKIDVSDELARVSQLVVKYKCSKQEVERAIVACEGDLLRAEESLRVQKQDHQATTAPVKQESTSNPKNLLKMQGKPAAASVMMPPRNSNERDLNYTRTEMSGPSDPQLGFPRQQCFKGNSNQQLLGVERRWLNSGSSPSLPSTIGLPQTKSEVLRGVSENTVEQHSAVTEHPVMMQRPRAAPARRIPVSGVSTSPSVSAGFYPSDNSLGAEILRSNMKFFHSRRMGSLVRENQGTETLYHQFKERPSSFGPFDSAPEMSSSWNTMGRSSSWNTVGGASPPSLPSPPSLGLFSSWGSSGSFSSNSSSQVDWQTGGLVPELDYTSIDWTLDSSLLVAASRGGGGLWPGLSLSTSRMAGGGGDGGRVGFSRWQESHSGVVCRDSAAAPGGLREWTSPFAGNDIFSLPRQLVTSPSP